MHNFVVVKKIAFIINPISGSKHKEKIIEYLHGVFDSTNYACEFHVTSSSEDAYVSAKKFAKKKFEIVVVVGGDGTINQVAKGIIKSDTKLGIIPVGSGNGLARHLKIPLSYQKAVELIINENTQIIDAGRINKEIFFCTAGLGFEATVGERFNSSKTRGLISYIEFCAREYISYKPESYEIDIQDNIYNVDAFLITFANCAQWGNNAHIAPDANASDGMIDMVVWKKSPMVEMPVLTAGLFLKTIKFSESIDTYRCKEVKITRARKGLIQFDGESKMEGKEINISVIKHALKVIVPSQHTLTDPIPFL